MKLNKILMFVLMVFIGVCSVNAINIINSTEVGMSGNTKTLVKTMNVNNFLINHTFEIYGVHNLQDNLKHDFSIYTKFYYNDSTNDEILGLFQLDDTEDEIWISGHINNSYQNKLIDYIEIYLKAQYSDESMKTRNNVLYINPLINVNANGEELTNDSYYNVTEVDFDVYVFFLNDNTNLSYSVDGGSLTQFTTNNQTGNFTLSSLTEGEHQIYFNAINDEVNITSSNYTFTIDLTTPIINLSFPNEYNYYTGFNLSQYINITDTNPDTCTVDFIYNDAIENTFNCTDINASFSYNGNYTFNVTATDLGGNTAKASDIMLVNTYQFFRFNSSVTGAYITDYQVDIEDETYSSVGQYVSIPLYDIGLGTHDLLFYKFGYSNTTNQVIFNTTSAYNTTYEIQPTTLSIKMYDATTPTTQVTFNVTIINSTDSETYFNQVNFSKQYNETITGEIQIIIQSLGYSDAYFYNTLEPFTSISINGHLIPINDTDVVTFQVYDRTTEKTLDGVTIEAQELINGSFQTISQALTGISGEAFMFLDITKSYKFIFSKDGYVQATSTSIPGVTTYTVRLSEVGSEYEFIDGVSYSFAPTGPVLYDGDNLTFKGFISGTSLTLITYKLTDQNGTTIYSSNSTNPTGTTFEYDINNLNSSQYSQLTQTMVYYQNGESKTVYRTYRTTAIGTESFIYYLKNDFAQSETENDQLFRWIAMVFTLGCSLLIGRSIGAGVIGNSLGIVIVSGFWMFVGWMPELYFGAITVMALGFALAGGQR